MLFMLLRYDVVICVVDSTFISFGVVFPYICCRCMQECFRRYDVSHAFAGALRPVIGAVGRFFAAWLFALAVVWGISIEV